MTNEHDVAFAGFTAELASLPAYQQPAYEHRILEAFGQPFTAAWLTWRREWAPYPFSAPIGG